MIVGPAFGDENGEPVWPCFELLTGGYYFTYRKDDDTFAGKINMVDFDHWLNFCDNLKKDNVENDFMDDTKDGGYSSFSDIANALSRHGCKEAKDIYAVLMSKYYDSEYNQ